MSDLWPDQMPPRGEPADDVSQTLQRALDSAGTPRRFSSYGLERLLRHQTEYLKDVGLEAIQVARRARNDEVQAVDVDRADEIVRAARGRTRRGYEAFGGILCGAGVSIWLPELFGRDPRMWLIAISVLVMLAGALMLVHAVSSRSLR